MTLKKMVMFIHSQGGPRLAYAIQKRLEIKDHVFSENGTFLGDYLTD